MNQFGDMLHSEFLAKFASKGQSATDNMKKVSASKIYMSSNNISLPTEIDWRSKGAVTAVRDQGDCNDCSHDIAAVESLEGQIFLKYHKLIQLSVQELIDCIDIKADHPKDWTLGIEKVLVMGGIKREEDYPYHGKNSTCRFDKMQVVAYVNHLIQIGVGERIVAGMLTEWGPLANLMNAAPRSFQFYSHGLYSDAKCRHDHLHHGALIVGYGITEDQKKYWTVKNSWGTGWGEDGYIRIAKGVNNTCGVASYAGHVQIVYLRT